MTLNTQNSKFSKGLWLLLSNIWTKSFFKVVKKKDNICRLIYVNKLILLCNRTHLLPYVEEDKESNLVFSNHRKIDAKLFFNIYLTNKKFFELYLYSCTYELKDLNCQPVLENFGFYLKFFSWIHCETLSKDHWFTNMENIAYCKTIQDTLEFILGRIFVFSS